MNKDLSSVYQTDAGTGRGSWYTSPYPSEIGLASLLYVVIVFLFIWASYSKSITVLEPRPPWFESRLIAPSGLERNGDCIGVYF